MKNKKNKVQSVEYVYGIHSIKELLKAKKRKIISLYTTRPEPKVYHEIKRLLPKYPVQIQYVSREKLSKIAGSDDHQGIVVLAYPYVYRTTFFDAKKHPFLLLLDGVQDVRNVGAILRTAHCTGVDGVVICKKGGAQITGAAHKSSAGLAEHVLVYQAASIQEAVQLLKKAGYQLYVTAFNGEDAANVTYKTPLCVVIGSEGSGVHKTVLQHGIQITLPQRSENISYNASVATGITLFLIAHQIGHI